MIEERYELAVERIRQIYQEESVNERFLPFFRETAEFLLMMDELKKQMEDAFDRAAEAVAVILKEGADRAMNQFN